MVKNHFIFDPVQKCETNWIFTGCQMPHFIIILIPYYQFIKLFWLIFEEYGAFNNVPFMNLTYKMPITRFTAAVTFWFLILFFFFFFFSEEIKLHISCKLSARQTICMKSEALLSQKNDVKNLKMSSATILLGTSSVKNRFEPEYKEKVIIS